MPKSTPGEATPASRAAFWFPSQSEAETRAVGAALARAWRPGGDDGALVLLVGPLGAGKTVFAKGLGEGLGIPAEAVASPTFVVASEYPRTHSGAALVHVDCYRVESPGALEAAGLRDWLRPRCLVAVEWADRFPEAWPEDRLRVTIGRGGEGEPRRIEVAADGPEAEAWAARWRDELASGAGPGE